MSTHTHLDLYDGDEVTVALPDGTQVRLSQGPPGSFDVTLTGTNDTPVVTPGGGSNVLRVVPWPLFQPVLPPSPERPVQVTRAQILRTLPNGSGLSTEDMAAVQARIDADPKHYTLIEDTICDVLTVRDSSYGGTQIIQRQTCLRCEEQDTDERPVTRWNGHWMHEDCREIQRQVDDGEICKRCMGTMRGGTIVGLQSGGWMHRDPCWTDALAEAASLNEDDALRPTEVEQ